MIDVMSIHQFANHLHGEQAASAQRMRGIFPNVKKMKNKKGKNKGGQPEPEQTQNSANPLDFTTTFHDNPMYDVNPENPMGDTFNPVERAKMRRTAGNARAFDAHINQRINEFRNGSV